MIGQIAGTHEIRKAIPENAVLLHVKNRRSGASEYTIINGGFQFKNKLAEYKILSVSSFPEQWPIGHVFQISPLTYVVKVNQV